MRRPFHSIPTDRSGAFRDKITCSILERENIQNWIRSILGHFKEKFKCNHKTKPPSHAFWGISWYLPCKELSWKTFILILLKILKLSYRLNEISRFGNSKSNISFYVCLAPKAGSTTLTSILLQTTGFFDDGTKQPTNVCII